MIRVIETSPPLIGAVGDDCGPVGAAIGSSEWCALTRGCLGLIGVHLDVVVESDASVRNVEVGPAAGAVGQDGPKTSCILSNVQVQRFTRWIDEAQPHPAWVPIGYGRVVLMRYEFRARGRVDEGHIAVDPRRFGSRGNYRARRGRRGVRPRPTRLPDLQRPSGRSDACGPSRRITCFSFVTAFLCLQPSGSEAAKSDRRAGPVGIGRRTVGAAGESGAAKSAR